MRVLIIRHGESQHNVRQTQDLDSRLTNRGMIQCCYTGAWLREQIDLTEFTGLVSPYHRTLQTASVLSIMCGVDFTTDDLIREYISEPCFEKWPELLEHHDEMAGHKGKLIPNRSLDFYNIGWHRDWLDIEEQFFPVETPDEWMNRLDRSMQSLERDKDYVIVTHASMVAALGALWSGTCDLQSARDTYNAPREGSIGIFNCSLTLVEGGKLTWNNRVVYG